MTDDRLEELLFHKTKTTANKRLPDFDYIRKELLRNGVNKKLLWVEYCEECQMNVDETLMYSQFCYHIQMNEESIWFRSETSKISNRRWLSKSGLVALATPDWWLRRTRIFIYLRASDLTLTKFPLFKKLLS